MGRGYDLTRKIMFSSLSKHPPAPKGLEEMLSHSQLTATGRVDHHELSVMAMTQSRAIADHSSISAATPVRENRHC